MFKRANRQLLIVCAMSLILGGCATWSESNVALKNEKTAEQSDDPSNTQTASVPNSAPQKQIAAADVVITTKDITDRPYRVIGDIDVTVNKTTIFHADPTKELVNKKLQEEAAKIGANAVILVRYGTVGVSFMSWGSLDGKGRAVAFTN